MADTLAIVIVSYNARDILVTCVERALEAASDVGAQVIVVDNASPDRSADHVAEQFGSRVSLVRNPRNGGFAYAVNRGVESTPASRILLLNPDCFLDDAEPLRRGLRLLAADPTVAASGCLLVDRERVPNMSYRAFPTIRSLAAERFGAAPPHPPGPAGAVVEVDSPSGAFFLIRREAWSDVGPFDEGYFLYYEETDWCWRARRRGWKLVIDKGSRVVHWGGETTRRESGQVRSHGVLVRVALDSRERYWVRSYGIVRTLLLKAVLAATSAAGLAHALVRRRGEVPLHWLRLRHALSLRRLATSR